MSSNEAEVPKEGQCDPQTDLYTQALHRVEDLVGGSSERARFARLWALFQATTAKLRYAGVARMGFAEAFEDACRLAEEALREDLEQASAGQLMRSEGRSGGAIEVEAPARLM